MNRFFSLLIVGLVFTAFNSCGNDDDGPFVLSETSLSGTWNVDDISGDGTVTATTLGETEMSDVTIVTDNSTATVDFTTDPNAFTSQGSITLTTTSVESDGTTTTDTETSEAFGGGTWVLVDATTLQLTEDGETTTYTLQPESTSSLLILVSELEFSLDFFGTMIDTDLTNTLRLSR